MDIITAYGSLCVPPLPTFRDMKQSRGIRACPLYHFKLGKKHCGEERMKPLLPHDASEFSFHGELTAAILLQVPMEIT